MREKIIIIKKFNSYFPKSQISEEEFFFDFHVFIKENFSKMKHESDRVFLNDFYTFLNQIGKSKSKKVIDLIEVAVLEVLTDEKDWQDLSFKYLTGNALKVFENLFVDKFIRL